VHEDPVPLTEIQIKLNVPVEIASVKTVYTNESLSLRKIGEGYEVLVPKIPISEMICFEIS